MQSLRSARLLARLVLAWFALSLGVAVASPLVKHSGFELVCSASGAAKLLVQGDTGSKPIQHTLDCPLCAGLDAPPAAIRVEAQFAAAPLAHAVQPVAAARIASLTAAPLPARGPPAGRQA